jgi:three-Cys-motif partner protein
VSRIEIDPGRYLGRVQTYVKHLVLSLYLERLAYCIGFKRGLVYVDGFAGPWRNEGEDLTDTSPYLALNRLAAVREGLEKAGRSPRLRAIFVELEEAKATDLRHCAAKFPQIPSKVLIGSFEEKLGEIEALLGEDFGFLFIDPTGWSGYPLEAIAPVLQGRGREVLINFMFDHVNRFVELPGSTEGSFDQLFGHGNWRERIPPKGDQGREEAIVRLYAEGLKERCGFAHVTFTRVLKPGTKRTYFYLIYGTHHHKGLLEFRSIEKKALFLQEEARLEVAREKQAPGQGSLFGPEVLVDHGDVSFAKERSRWLERAKEKIVRELRDRDLWFEQDLLPLGLEEPYVWREDIRDFVLELRRDGKIKISGMTGKKRVPQPTSQISWIVGLESH